MNLIERAKNICLTPKTEWDVISTETTETSQLLLGYVLPLAGFSALMGFVSNSIIGHSGFGITVRSSILSGIGMAVFTLVMAVVAVFLISLVINVLAPSFGGEKNSAQAMKAAAYSLTPAWLSSVFQLLPWIGILLMFAAACYGIYLLYFALMKLMKSPEDKAVGYTAVTVICTFVLGAIFSALTMCVGGLGMMATGGLSSGLGGGLGSGLNTSSSSSNVTIDKNSPLGKLEQFGKQMEAAGKKMETAEKSGDDAAKMAAATGMLGALLGGGKNVEPIGIDQLKPFVPETMAGLAKKTSKTEKTGMAGLMISKAEATYGDDSGKSIEFDLSDTGGASGLMGMASWMNVQGEKEDQYGSEKTSKVNGRLVNEKVSKSGGSNEVSVVVGDRFVVSVKGRGLSIDEVRKAVASIDLGKLEAMKDVGVTAAK